MDIELYGKKDLSEEFEKLHLMDDIRKLANELIRKGEFAETEYDLASSRAKMLILGADIPYLTQVRNQVEQESEDLVYKQIAKEELPQSIKVELYSDAQLKEIIIAHRMGVDVASFVNIFFTPEQLEYITLISAIGMDITPYITDLKFDPKKERENLGIDNVGAESPDGNKIYQKAA